MSEVHNEDIFSTEDDSFEILGIDSQAEDFEYEEDEQEFDNSEAEEELEQLSFDHLPYPELARRYKTGEGLTDEDIDFIANISLETLKQVLEFFDAEDSVIDEYEGGRGELIFDIMNPDLAVLIGRHGKTLEALQLMVSSIVNKRIGFRFPIIIDIESYKNRRQRKLEDIAFNAAERAVRTRRPVKLHPMSSYDRRVIHMTLRSNKRVSTYSEGEEPERRVVIQLRQER